MRLLGISPIVGVFVALSAFGGEDTSFAEAILRHEMSNGTIDRKIAFCISINGQDVSEDFINRFRDLGLTVMHANTQCDQHIPFGWPQELEDGTFEVSYGYFIPECDDCVVQGHAMSATMRRVQDGWRVVAVRGTLFF
jgi:hypothetical protein